MEDTIAAIATAYGEGGIGIVRISGPRSKEILENVFRTVKKSRIKSGPYEPQALSIQYGAPIENRRLTYGNVIEWKENPDGSLRESVVDEAMAVFMKEPFTYTMEDTAEIQCHGSVVSLRKTLELVLRNGARLAEPGEFTKRAFLNGRIDLTQAEAVIDVVKAKSERGYTAAMNQLEGRLSQEIRSIREKVTDFLSLVIVNLDYPDEDIEEVTYEECGEKLRWINCELERILGTAETGKMLREGLSVAIIGRPNVGKSSLMNQLLGESRAIVTEIPGTTRDVIEEGLSIRGIPIRLIDTAGIRQTVDQIEQMGIEKTRESLEQADLVLYLIDGSKSLSEEDFEISRQIQKKKVLILLNKDDLDRKVKEEDLKHLLPEAEWIRTSMTDGRGIDLLEDKIEHLVYQGKVYQEESAVVTNVRQKELLLQAVDSVHDAIEMLRRGEALDFVEMDLRRCWELLGEITGESVTDEIIDEVFSRFCLGK